MSWGRLEDKFWRDDDIDKYDISASAIGLFWLMISYSSDKRTRGIVPVAAVRRLPGGDDKRNIGKLMEAGWIVEDEAGYLIRSFNRYNPGKEVPPSLSETRRTNGQKGGVASGETRRKKSKTEPNDEANSFDNGSKNEANSFDIDSDDEANHQANSKQPPTCVSARWDSSRVPTPESQKEIIANGDSLSEGVPRARAQSGNQPQFSPPSEQSVLAHFEAKGFAAEGPKFWAHYSGNGWMKGDVPVVSWTMTAESWLHKRAQFEQGKRNGQPQKPASIATTPGGDRYAHLPPNPTPSAPPRQEGK